MKTIGLLGGMSWESSAEYYRIINECVRERLGGTHSAKCVMHSMDFAEIEALQDADRWDDAALLMIDAARGLERAGADFLVICTNTMHLMADPVERSIGIPLLHIADAAAERIAERGIRVVGMLATRFTMERDFYRNRLAEKRGVEVVTPVASDREIVHRVIYDELVSGRINEASRLEYARIIRALVERGAEGILLACTEIGLLVKQEDSPVPLFDTTPIHARAAVELAFGG